MAAAAHWPQSCQPQLGCSVDAENDVPAIFSEIVAVHVKPAGRDEFTAALTIRLRPDNLAHPRHLLMELTDENDFLFYHSLMLGEGDFHALKTEQRLRVDFQAFPAQLVDLLRRCMAEGTAGTPGATEGLAATRSPSAAFSPGFECHDLGGGARFGGGSRMLAHLECSSSGDSLFSIMESNPFRELTHIALRLRQGTDVAVKQHLASKLRTARAEATDFAERLRASEEQLTQARRQNDELVAHVRGVSEERGHLEHAMDAAHQRELAEVREQSARALCDLQRSVAEDRARAEGESKQSYETALARAEAAERSNQELAQRQQTLTISSKSCQERLEAAESQLREARLEESQLREQLKQLEVTKFKHEQEIGEFKVQVSGLRGQISAKEQLAASQAAQLEQATTQRRSLEESLQASKQHVVSLEEKFGIFTQEITKGNQIIKTLHTNLKQAKAKLKLKTSDLARHEKSILDLERTGDLTKHAMGEKEHELSRGQERQATLERDAGDLKTKLGEAHEVLKTNQEVIEYLNRQLTERDLKGISSLAGIDVYAGGTPPKTAAPSSLGFGGLPSGGRGLWTGTAHLPAEIPRSHDLRNLDSLLRSAAAGASPQLAGLEAKVAPVTPLVGVGHLRGPVAYRSPV